VVAGQHRLHKQVGLARVAAKARGRGGRTTGVNRWRGCSSAAIQPAAMQLWHTSHAANATLPLQHNVQPSQQLPALSAVCFSHLTNAATLRLRRPQHTNSGGGWLRGECKDIWRGMASWWLAELPPAALPPLQACASRVQRSKPSSKQTEFDLNQLNRGGLPTPLRKTCNDSLCRLLRRLV